MDNSISSLLSQSNNEMIRNKDKDNKTITRKILPTSFLYISSIVAVTIALLTFSILASTSPVTFNDKKVIIVVGGGLAGLSATVEALRAGAPAVMLIDKQPNLGGNSARATSGINAALTSAQFKLGIDNDSIETFIDDIIRSGQGKAHFNLAHVLSSYSSSAVSFLELMLNKTLSNVVMLGGHSVPRTHKLPIIPGAGPSPIGYLCIAALKEWLGLQSSERLKVQLSTRLVDLHFSDDGSNILGISVVSSPSIQSHNTTKNQHYDNAQQYVMSYKKQFIPAAAVILASGGFAADLDPSQGLVSRYSQFAARSMFTTNGPFATGDVLRIAEHTGLSTIDLDQIQLHPTGFVDPKDPFRQEKMLCPEYLRGVGGILLNRAGRRFVNELDRRDIVSTAIFRYGSPPEDWGLQNVTQTPPAGKEYKIAALLINEKIRQKIGEATFKFYESKGLFLDAGANIENVANFLNFSRQVFEKTLQDYSEASESKTKDPFGKTTFPVIFNDKVPTRYFIAYVTPSVHYTMGGIRVNEEGQALSFQNKKVEENKQLFPVNNLFAAGEVVGGVHGANRLGGNGMLENVVNGRLVGSNAAHLVLAERSKGTPLSLKELLNSTTSPSVHNGADSNVTQAISLRVRSIGNIDEEGRFYRLRLALPSISFISGLPVGTQVQFQTILKPPRHVVKSGPITVAGWCILASPEYQMGFVDIIIPPRSDHLLQLKLLHPGDKVLIYLSSNDAEDNSTSNTRRHKLSKSIKNDASLYIYKPRCKRVSNDTSQLPDLIAVDINSPAVGIVEQVIDNPHIEVILLTPDEEEAKSYSDYLNKRNPTATIKIVLDTEDEDDEGTHSLSLLQRLQKLNPSIAAELNQHLSLPC